MKKRISFLTPVIIIAAVILTAAMIVLHSLSPIITGYAAKNLASGIFVAGRTQESLEKEELTFSLIKYTHNEVDYKKKEVTSRFLFWKSKAVFIEGFGCTLVRGFPEEEIKSRPYTKVPLPLCNPDTLAWPAGDKPADSIPRSLDIHKLNAFLDTVFADTLPMKGTFAVAIAYKGQLVAERYRDDLSADNLFLSWSMAKSFTSTLTGILVSEKKMDVAKPVQVSEWPTAPRSLITLGNLLHMNSGLVWKEEYSTRTDVTRMLYAQGDMALFAINQEAEAQPDSLWSYASGSTNIVCRLIREAIGNDAEYYAFPRKRLFNKIGMRSAVFETDASGNFIGSSYLYASMRDYVRYGLLYLNKGNWLGEQVIPEAWVDYTTAPVEGSNGKYGASFWLNRGGEYPAAPTDTYNCKGHDGQYLFIIPSKELVIVRTGYSSKRAFDANLFLKGILDCLEENL